MNRRGHSTAAVGEHTRLQILDVAEKLFAENGPEAVSIRAIATAAQVNLAAVNYHFGTKERLFEEIFRRRVVPLNEQRLALLDALVAKAGPGRLPSLEAIVEAFVTPPLRLAAEEEGSARAMVVMQFLSHAFSSPNETAFLETYYEPVRTRFIGMLVRALPDLAPEDVLWRYNFLVGAIIYAMGGPARMTRPPKALETAVVLRPADGEEAIRQLVAYATAGFRAPLAVRARKSPKTEPQAGGRARRRKSA